MRKRLEDPAAPDKANDLPARLEAAAARLFERLEEEPPGIGRYRLLAGEETYAEYRAVAEDLPNFDPAVLDSRNDRIAFWVNLHNCLIVEALASSKALVPPLKHLPRKARRRVGQDRLSAREIRDGVLRGNRPGPLVVLPPFGMLDRRRALALEPPDPRVLFILFTGARSGPRPLAIRPDEAESALEKATRRVLNGPEVDWDGPRRTLRLPRIFFWFGRDFGDKAGSAAFVAPYLADEGARVLIEKNPRKVRIRYQAYDWTPA